MQGQATAVFNEVLRVANYFLHQGKSIGSVSVLAEKEDPTFGELAEFMDKLILIMDVIASKSEICPMLAQKMVDYTSLVKKMAIAIKAQEQSVFDGLVAELDRKPFC